MKTLTTVVMAGIALMLMAGCGSHDMMDESMDTKMTGMEETMDAKSETMIEPATDTMTQTMQ